MKLPQAPDKYDASNERQARGILEQADQGYFKKGQDVELVGQDGALTRSARLILRSPNGTRWSITVSNAGAVVVTSL
jgi:hypothetical protein